MSSIKIKLVELVSDMKNLDQVLMSYVDLHGVHPILSAEIVGKVHGLTSLATDNPSQAMLDVIEDMESQYQFKIPDVEVKDDNYDFRSMEKFINELNEKLATDIVKISELQENIQKYSDAMIQVQNIENLEIPLDDLFACEYVYFRFGRIPNDSLDKLKLFMNRPFVFKSFNHDKNKTWCMYYTTNEYKREVDNIFSSMLFERIIIPDFIHGTPKDAMDALKSENMSIQKMIDAYQEEFKQSIDKNLDHLTQIKGELLFLNRVFDAKKYVLGMGNKFIIISFINVDAIDDFKKIFAQIDSFEISVKEPYSDGRITPPKHIKEKWFFI